jgi:hypothetical protein
LNSTDSATEARGASHLVKKAEIDYQNDLCIIPVESIYSPIISLPYQINDNTCTAKEWILLSPKASWNQIFFDYMKKIVSNTKEQSVREQSNRKRKNLSK